MAQKVIVGCKSGDESTDTVKVAYLTAGAALDQGREVVMWLTSEGVRLGLNGYAAGIATDNDPQIGGLHDQFVEKGGRMFVCPVCFNDRELNEADLTQGAELKGATPLLEFAGENALAFTY